jgi:hypothetical protein
MTKANEYVVKITQWDSRPTVLGPAVFRKDNGEQVTAAWVPDTEITVIDTDKGAVAVIQPPTGNANRLLLDA